MEDFGTGLFSFRKFGNYLAFESKSSLKFSCSNQIAEERHEWLKTKSSFLKYLEKDVSQHN